MGLAATPLPNASSDGNLKPESCSSAAMAQGMSRHRTAKGKA